LPHCHIPDSMDVFLYGNDVVLFVLGRRNSFILKGRSSQGGQVGTSSFMELSILAVQ